MNNSSGNVVVTQQYICYNINKENIMILGAN